MKVSIDRKVLMSLVGIAESFSSIASKKQGDALDKSLTIGSKDDSLHLTCHAHTINSGVNLVLTKDDIDFTIDESGEVTVYSKWFNDAVGNLSSHEVQVTDDGEGVTINGSGESVRMDIPDVDDEVNWEKPPLESYDEHIICNSDDLQNILGASTPPGIPLLDNSVVMHTDVDENIIIGSAERHPYFVSLLKMEVEENTLEDDVLIHSDYIPIVINALKQLSDEETKVRVSHDMESSRVVYTVIKDDDRVVANIWAPVATSNLPSNDMAYTRLEHVANKVSTTDECIKLILPSIDFQNSAKSAIAVGKASGAVRDSQGNVDKNGQVLIVVDGDDITIASPQESSTYTAGFTMGVDTNEKTIIRFPFNLVSTFLRSPLYTGLDINLNLSPLGNGKGFMASINPTGSLDIEDMKRASLVITCSVPQNTGGWPWSNFFEGQDSV